ncbi:GntR family transcriptional regulator [Leucobacter sp. Psy1]|uniref:FadR/GntR family transcriptional regulator n=1 Tax=Leucobacter sp. Psy1 TaxID=2875729 RepID=UPI001CD3E36E|nr:GntR family transcriptional regulator [Leucobacter sp. Psy1]UBH07071.1 GntR family transcriptional regulator [Leucobacter sp. Psy1]
MPTREGIELLAHAVRPANAYEETVQRLLQSVRLGLIMPGERLPSERDLATMLGVSRDTLRDAISTLAEAGYVVSRRGRYGGTFVRDELPAADGPTSAPLRRTPGADDAEVEDVTVLRRIVEVGAAREAAARELPASARAALATALDECGSASLPHHRRLDSRLHLTIAEVSGSPSLVPIAADLRTRLNTLLDSIPVLAPNIEHSNEQHDRIVAAILSGRADEAAAAMSEHIAGSEALLRGFLTDSLR